jgi:hypothetical protein
LKSIISFFNYCNLIEEIANIEREKTVIPVAETNHYGFSEKKITTPVRIRRLKSWKMF